MTQSFLVDIGSGFYVDLQVNTILDCVTVFGIIEAYAKHVFEEDHAQKAKGKLGKGTVFTILPARKQRTIVSLSCTGLHLFYIYTYPK